MLEFPGEGVNLRKSAVFCENLRFGLSLSPLSSVPLSAPRLKVFPLFGVSEMASAKTASAIDVRIDDVGSILKFRIGFPFGENSAGF